MISSYFESHQEFSKIPFLQVATLLDEEQQKIEFLFEHYHHRATELDKAHAYFEKRGISDESIEKFQRGYSDTSLCRLLQQVTNQESFRELLKRIGFLNPKGHQLCLGCIVLKLGGDDE